MNTTQIIWRHVLAPALALLFWVQAAHADSVGQVQTTKYFAPETVAMIKQRVADVSNGVPGATLGFKQGDTISYIIQFTPIANTSLIGAGGYITDYIPSGTQVTGAWFVQPDGAGGFYQTSPPDPAQMADGWGAAAQGTFVNWTPNAETLAKCVAAGKTTANCTGRLSQIYADTGIFYSADPRTAVFVDPSTDGRVAQWINGYNINPRGTAQLPQLMGGVIGAATTHNLWDAAMTNAFGTLAAGLPVITPNAGNGSQITTANVGVSPFNVGSAVAGPDSGYQLDYTGSVGPWRRIYYPGSMVGSNSAGPAIAAGTNGVLATSTSAGASFPLPANTNAVRWAAGRLVVGTQNYVKINLLLTSPPPGNGLVNNSEVFGGDGSPESGQPAAPGGAGNRDNPWVYHVPSVASNVSTLYILKEVVCLYDATGTCVANNGANLPLAGTPATMGPKVRYRISYINTNNGTQHNVTLCDQLPDGARMTPVAAQVTFATGVTQVSATPNLGAPTSPAIAACGFAAGGTTFNYPTIPVLAGGGAGIVEYDVQYPLFAAGNVSDNIVNGAKAVSTEIPAGVTSYSPSNLVSAITANLQISKSVYPAKANKGDTVTYTISIANTGSNAASLTSVADTLPGVATALVANQAPSRFNYVATNSVSLSGAPLSGVTAVMTPPAIPGTTNKELVTWTFPPGTSLPGGGLLTLEFTATLGNNSVPANNLLVYGTAYTNTATVTYTGGAAATATTVVLPSVTVSIPNLTVAKTIDCVFSGATCTAGSYVTGSAILPNAQLRYKIVYTNPEVTAQTITLSDTLPASATAAGNLYVESGPDIRPSTPVLSVNPATAGAARGADAALTAIAPSSVVAFIAASLPGSSSGTLYMDVQTNVAAAGVVTNSASISSTQRTAAGGAAIPASAISATAASLTITKTASVASVAPGGTVNYTITVTNPTAAGIVLTSVADTLPKPLPNLAGRTILCGTSAANCLLVTAVTINGAAPAVAPTLVQTAATATVGQINTWTLGGTAAERTLNAGQTMTLTFTATYSATVLRGNVYNNTATVNYTGGASATGSVAPVTVPYNTLSVSKAVIAPASASIAPNSPVTYAITVTNTGLTAAPITSVVDTLPAATVGTIAYTSTTSVLVNGVAQTGVAGAPVGAQYTNPAPAAAVAGTQQVVTWTLPAAGTTIIPAGATMVITFVAQFGAIPTGITYYNDMRANYTGGLTTAESAANLAPVSVPTISKITKTIDCVYSGATCTPGSYVDGTPIQVNAKLGYKIVYENLSALAASGITITDILPTLVGANAISNLIVNGVATAAPANAAGGGTVTLLAGGTLNAVNTAGSTGTINFDLQTTVTAGAGVTNTGKIASTQDPVGMSSSVTAAATGGNLTVTKAVTTATPSTVAQGGTASYTITVKNDGSTNATLNTLADTLPGVANAAGATWRFVYAATGAMTLNGPAIAPAFTAVVTPPAAPATTNNEVVTWTLTGGLIIPAGQTFTLTFTATVGTLVPKGAAAPGATYYNNVTANYTGGVFPSATATGQAPVLVSFNALMMNKTIDCVFSGITCVAYVPGASIPTSATVRYLLSYGNLSPLAQIVTIKDTLPASTTAAGNLYVASGPDVRPSAPVLSVNAAAAGAARGADVALTAIAASTTVAMTATSIPANTSGSLYIDVQSAAASGASATNCASISTVPADTCITANVIKSSVTATVYDLAQLAVTKTTSTPTLAPGNRATYTITIQNTGAGATNTLKVLDFLPFDGGTADATKRLNYFATTGYAVNGVATALTPTITTSTPPLVAPFGSNSNQQQVQWDFGNYVLASGATLTITFTADAGANMTPGVSYGNSAQTQYTSSTTSLVSTVSNTAPINLIPHVTLSKTIVAVCGGAGCTPTAYTPGAMLPANAKIRYQIVYTNSSATTAQANVVLSDLLPAQTAAAPVSNVVIASGPITAPAPATLAALAAGGATLTFPMLASLPASGTGTITLDVQTNAAAPNVVSNTAKVLSAEDASGVTSTVAATVSLLTLSKTTSTPNVMIGGTATYTISITNISATPTTSLQVYDFLPYSGAVADVTNRFAYVSTTGYTGGLPAPTITTAAAPTVAPYSANTNQQQVLWDFGGYALAAGATVTVTFTATVGSAIPVASYTNSAGYQYTSAAGPGSMNTDGLAVISAIKPPVLSFTKLVYIFSDPANGTVNPKFIPGSVAAYTLVASNAGGAADSDSTVITDPVPANTALYVGDIGAVGSGPVLFTQGATSSTLTYMFTALNNMADDVSFSNDNGVTWAAVPAPGADSCDPAITHLRINPKGAFAGNATAPSPSFQLVFRVCVK